MIAQVAVTSGNKHEARHIDFQPLAIASFAVEGPTTLRIVADEPCLAHVRMARDGVVAPVNVYTMHGALAVGTVLVVPFTTMTFFLDVGAGKRTVNHEVPHQDQGDARDV